MVVSFFLALKPSTIPQETCFLAWNQFSNRGRSSSEHLGYFLHGFKLRAHCLGAPFIQKLSGPVGRRVQPEELNIFFQNVTSDRP